MFSSFDAADAAPRSLGRRDGGGGGGGGMVGLGMLSNLVVG